MSVERFENCNDVPCDSQEAYFKNEINQLDARIADIDDKIAILQQERAQVDAQRRRYFRALSALRRLPNEIIFLIFSFLDNTSLLRASKVCHRWREIILGWPGFWTELEIPPLYPGSRRPERPDRRLMQAHVEHYVLYARGQPISLSIKEFDIDSEDSNLECFVNLMWGPLQVRKFKPCWKSLSLESQLAPQMEQFLLYSEYYPSRMKDFSALSLSALDLHFDDKYTYADWDEEEEDGEGPPEPVTELDLTRLGALRQLRLDCMEFVSNIFKVHWDRLTSLFITCDGGSDEYLQLLSQCGSLEVLSIQPYDYTGITQGETVTLPHLRKLTITHEDQPSTLLEGLHAPKLQELDIHYVSLLPSRLETDQSLQHFLDRLRGNLRSLRCTGEVLSGNMINMRSIQQLEAFHLIAPYEEWDDTVFERLTDPSLEINDRLPQLKELVAMDHPPLSALAIEACIKLLKARCEPGSEGRLRRVEIHEHVEEIMKCRRELDNFRQRGILLYDIVR